MHPLTCSKTDHMQRCTWMVGGCVEEWHIPTKNQVFSRVNTATNNGMRRPVYEVNVCIHVTLVSMCNRATNLWSKYSLQWWLPKLFKCNRVRSTLFWIFVQCSCDAAYANDSLNANRTSFGVQQPPFPYSVLILANQSSNWFCSPRHLQSIYIG